MKELISGEATLLDREQTSVEISSLGYEKQAQRMLRCGCDDVYFTCGCRRKNLKKKYIKVKARCLNRVCPECAQKRSSSNYFRFISHLKKYRIARTYNDRGLRLVTFTTENCVDLREGINHIRHSFRKLRQRAYFKRTFRGGLAVIEAKKSNELWNVHMHVLTDSNFINMKSRKFNGNAQLVDSWYKCSKSYIIDVKRAYGYKGGLNYILKYVSKPLSNEQPKDSALYFSATYRTRLIISFGNLYGIGKNEKKWKCPKCGIIYTFHSTLQYIEGEILTYHQRLSYTYNQLDNYILGKDPPDTIPL